MELAQNQEKYLTFSVANEHYCLEILKVREIVAMMEISIVPLVPKFIKGIINLRGQVIPVIDIRLKFNLEPKEYTKHTTIIIIDTNDLAIGFIVDTTSEVITISNAELMPAPTFGTAIDTSFLKYMAKIKDQIITIVDLEKLFHDDELAKLTQSLQKD